jgi:hypothetical protein
VSTGNRAGCGRRPNPMRRTPALAVTVFVLFAVVGCGRGDGAVSVPAGGIEGTVTAGPTCPVETASSPCPPGTWQGNVRATDADGGSFDTTTDEQGRYSLRLPPGSYTVAPATAAGVLPTGRPVDVTVADTVVHLDLQVDTGIR